MASSLPQMSEAELQQNVIDMAHVFGWLVHAERPAMRADGTWRTPIQGDKGFPTWCWLEAVDSFWLS
jgi:hypothetical protein